MGVSSARDSTCGRRNSASKAAGEPRPGPVAAFVLLEREGLVSSSRHRGVSVVELTRRNATCMRSTLLRSALEPLAITLAIQRATATDLAEIDRSLAEMTAGFSRRITERDAAMLDVQFHDSIYQAAHHQRLSSKRGSRSGCPRTGSCYRATSPARTGGKALSRGTPRYSGSSAPGTKRQRSS